MIDYLALIGDKSDDIPGVAGIGPKTAIPLIQKYGSVENIYKHIDEIEKEGLKNKLIENKENALLSKELATIHCEVPLDFNFEEAKFEHPDMEKIKSIFIELEFSRLFNRLLNVYKFDSAIEPIENVVTDDVKAFDNKLNLTKEAFTIRANGDAFAPFSIFFEDETNKSIPFWWTTYNKLKHDYSKNLELANLQAAICALGSLFILNCKIPYNQETLILNGVISSPNFIHIGHFLGYMAQEEKTKIYNVREDSTFWRRAQTVLKWVDWILDLPNK